MINLKSISKNVLLEVANKLVLRFEDEIPVKKDIISSISKYIHQKEKKLFTLKILKSKGKLKKM
jgi:hypothetical protein